MLVGTAMPASVFLGGWTLDVPHAYDPIGGVLNLGNGGRRDTAGSVHDISTVAGNGFSGFSGDGGPATSAALYTPLGIAVGPDGSLYIADYSTQRIRRVRRGIITTVAGNGLRGFSGDGGPATSAKLAEPYGVAVAPDGSLYIADRSNNRIRRVDPDGIITTVAGNGTASFSGDGGPATSATFSFPQGVAVGPDGSLYIVASSNARIRRVGPDGIITTVAGGGTAGLGDGGPATSAQLRPTGVAIGPDGSLYVADSSNDRIRRVGPDGIITTVAGNGLRGFSGDGGPATSAQLNNPSYGVAAGPDGSLYIADSANNRIRRVDPDGIITTVAGNGTASFSGDGGPATSATLAYPAGIAVGADGTLYVTDNSNRRIRHVGFPLPGFAATDITISSEDGSQIYRFDSAGRHLDTLDAVTGTPIYTFSYDANGLLISITDLDGDITHIERASDGAPVAIVSADGQRTDLTLNRTATWRASPTPRARPGRCNTQQTA